MTHWKSSLIPRIGCAGWSIPRQFNASFPAEGTHLSRYAPVFNAVEINSSFYKPHRPATYARWADSTPADFRFAVKMPKLITHESGLRDVFGPLEKFLGEVQALGEKLGPILVQLPPRLKWDTQIAATFFGALRGRCATPIVCEPRHASWLHGEVDAFFEAHRIARVIADPAIANAPPPRMVPGSLCYFRLHGSPRMYYSPYDETYLASLAKRVMALDSQGFAVWCIFDNTALGAATDNALKLCSLIR